MTFKTRSIAEQFAAVARRLGHRALIIKTAHGFTVLHTI